MIPVHLSEDQCITMSCPLQELYYIIMATTDRLTFIDQVYKIVVQWSNGKSTVIYRRYSMFFDFQVSNL